MGCIEGHRDHCAVGWGLASVRSVTTWGVTVRLGVVAAAALAAGACSGSGDADGSPASSERTSTTASTTTTAPERAASTTTTAYDPAAVEGQIEAAYLRSWDVYAQAVYDLELDEAALAEVYAGEHLATKTNEIERRIDEGRAALVRIDHDYSIQLVDATTAVVIDQYTNHQVLIDPDTKAPIEADPNELVVDAVTLKPFDGVWKVTFKERLS